jgi:hypothetical protein
MNFSDHHVASDPALWEEPQSKAACRHWIMVVSYWRQESAVLRKQIQSFILSMGLHMN